MRFRKIQYGGGRRNEARFFLSLCLGHWHVTRSQADLQAAGVPRLLGDLGAFEALWAAPAGTAVGARRGGLLGEPAGTSRCRSRWAERTHTHTQTGRARASGDRAGRAGGAQLPPPLPPLLLLVPPLVLMLQAPRQKGQPRDVQQRPRRLHNLLSTAKLALATCLFFGFHLQVVSCGELLSFPLPKFHSSSPV